MCSFCTREGSLSKFFFSSSKIFLCRFKYIFNSKEMYDTECKNHNRFLQWHLKTENKNNLKPKKAASVLLKDNFKGKNYQIEN